MRIFSNLNQVLAMRRLLNWRVVLVAALLLSGIETAMSDELVLIRNNSEEKLQGEIIVEAEDGSLLFRTLDARLWVVKADEI